MTGDISPEEIKKIGRVISPYIPKRDPAHYEDLPGSTAKEKNIYVLHKLNWSVDLISEAVELQKSRIYDIIRKNTAD